jgi:hypothetical protein
MRKINRYIVRYFSRGRWNFVTRSFRHLTAALKTAEKLVSNALISSVEVLMGGLGFARPVRSFA